MLETITAGLSVAAVSGITYVAYKHPAAYRTVYQRLTWLTLAILIVIGIWSIGAQSAYTQLIRLIETSKLPQMEDALGHIMYRFRVVFAACVGTNLYLLLLSYLPKLLEQEKKIVQTTQA
jgi:hypothetical protein